MSGESRRGFAPRSHPPESTLDPGCRIGPAQRGVSKKTRLDVPFGAPHDKKKEWPPERPLPNGLMSKFDSGVRGKLRLSFAPALLLFVFVSCGLRAAAARGVEERIDRLTVMEASIEAQRVPGVIAS